MSCSRERTQIIPIYSLKPLRRAQEAALRVIESLPSLAKELPNDSILRMNNNKLLSQSGLQPIGHLEASPDTHRKPVGYSPQPGMNNQKVVIVSHAECQKKYNELEEKHRKLEKDYFSLQNDSRLKDERYIKREHRFRKVIEELETKLKTYMTADEAEKMNEINDLHQNILEKIEQFQNRTSKMLVDQEKDIIRFFDVKVNEIKEAYEQEKIKFRENHKKFNEKEEQLIAEMEWIKSIAQKMDRQNQLIHKKYLDLKVQQSMNIDEDRLIKEIMRYKRKTAVLECQIEQYEKIVQEFAKDREIKHLTPEGLSEQHREPSPLMNSSDISLSMPGTKARYDPKDRSLPSTNYIHSTREDSPVRSQELSSSIAAVHNLKATLQKERKQKQQLKSAYIKEVQSKSELTQILKDCIEDVRNSLAKFKNNKPTKKGKDGNEDEKEFDEEQRALLIEKLLNNEKLLSLLYDKTFHSKKLPLGKFPEILIGIDDDDDF